MGCLPRTTCREPLGRTTERPMREQGAVPQSHGPVCQSTGRRKSVVRGSLNKERGFSLIELLAAVAISGLVLGAATGSFMSQSRSYDAQGAVNEMHHRARVAMDMMTREIRIAGYNPTGGNFFAVQLNPADRVLEIRADLGGDAPGDPPDGDASDTNEHISYDYQNSGQIIRTIRRRDGAGTWEAFVDNIDSFDFEGFDSNGNSTTTNDEVVKIRITITARTAKSDPNYPLNDGFRTYTLTSFISPRNL